MNDEKGSIWRKWDFHVHTPFSVLNNGFGTDIDQYVQVLFKTAIAKNIAAIGITDYFSIEGYKIIINDYINKEEKLKNLFTLSEIERIQKILIVPNIEFRLHELIDGKRINFHVILSNELKIQEIEEHFLHELDFVHESHPFEKDNTRKLKLSNLAELGKLIRQDQPEFSDSNDLTVGMITATVQHKDISDRLQDKRFKDKYIIGVPPDENLSSIKWTGQGHMIRKSIIQKSNFLFTSNSNTIEWALGKKSGTQEIFINEFKSLKPCLWGSDAHTFEKLFEPDKERYCWIKADPTFEGIRQILYEPEERVYIGKEPPIIELVRNNPTKYFKKLVIKPLKSYNGKNGKWFDNTSIEFNNGLCGIIGNKGKGKSAIADILGLLGNSKVSINESKEKLFSFLNRNKFCKKGFAENFKAILYWNDDKEISKMLNEDINLSNIERIKYIPQKFFEDLCSTENDEHFREELNNVVFSRVENKDKLGKRNFNEFLKYVTELIEIEIKKLKTSLEDLNVDILNLEKKKTNEYKAIIENKIKGKINELEAHNKLKEEIVIVKNPSEDETLSNAQKQKSEKITELSEKINKLQLNIGNKTKQQETLEIGKYELIRFTDDIIELEGFIKDWKSYRQESFIKYGIDINKVITLNSNDQSIKNEKKKIEDELSKLENLLSTVSIKDDNGNEISLRYQLKSINILKEQMENELEKPFKDYHDYQKNIKDWEIKKKEIEGDINSPNTLKYFQREKEYLDKELEIELRQKLLSRNNITIGIYKKKKEVQDIYNSIKTSITELLSIYSNEQKVTLETSFHIEHSFYEVFFEQYVKRYKDFYQNADNVLRDLTLNYDFDNEKSILHFITGIMSKDKILKESTSEASFLNYIYSLDYINPRYNLKLNNKGLNELSPGERGGLLLIFYLILDKDDKPLVIDQPEDNLDNQSVSEILVPYIREAKKRRQIIIITHNPNLAVVADADQIIRMDIDKENEYLVSHFSGAIENPVINKAVVDILEGKMKAFNNRKVKYYTKT